MTDVQVITPMETARMRGDFRELAPADRQRLAMTLAAEAGLAWGASPPVMLITAEGGRLVPYVTKSGADMLAAIRGASIVSLDVHVEARRKVVNVTATASLPDGRTNVDVGSAPFDTDPKSYSRARMIATTRARRRVLLGLLGSGFAWSEAGDRQAGLEDGDDD